MSGIAVLMMVLIPGLIWGGFLYLLTRAVRSESAKREVGDAG